MNFSEKIQALESNITWIHREEGLGYRINDYRKVFFDKNTAYQYFHHKDSSGTPRLIQCSEDALEGDNSEGYIRCMLSFPRIDPNISDEHGMTALMHLARSLEDRQFTAAKLFLNHPCIKINAVDNQNKTALHYAIDANNMRLAKTLLMHAILQNQIGLSITAINKMLPKALCLRDTNGNTALHHAMTHKQHDVIVALLNKAPDLINTPNKNGITPFAMACQQPQMNILNMMLEKKNDIALKTIYQSVNGNLKNPVLVMLDEHLQAVNASTLASKINPIIRNRHNIVLLTRAISIAILIGILVTPISFFEIRFLIVFGLMPLIISAFVATFNIHYYARNGQFDMIVYLIRDGAAINRQDADGKTPLILAAIKGHLHIVKYLVEQGANKYMKSKRGNTALIWAAYNGHLDVVEYLVKQGADTNIHGEQGKTALEWAQARSKHDVVRFLQKHQKKNATLAAALWKRPVVVERLSSSLLADPNDPKVVTVNRDDIRLANEVPGPSAPPAPAYKNG